MAWDSFESWSKDNDRWKEYIKLRSRKWEIKVERRGKKRYLGSEHLFCHPQDITTISHTNTSKQFTQTALLWIVCDINHLMLDKHWNNSRTNRALSGAGYNTEPIMTFTIYRLVYQRPAQNVQAASLLCYSSVQHTVNTQVQNCVLPFP